MHDLDPRPSGDGGIAHTTDSLALLDLPRGLGADDLTVDSIAELRRRSFRSVAEIERLRRWVDAPGASGLGRGLALWLLGRHAEACPILESALEAHPAVAVCLAHAHAAAGRFDEALAVLGPADEHPEFARARMNVAESRGDAGGLERMLERHGGDLSPADRSYGAGRLREMRHDPEGAIALYEQALALDERHGPALFRLAFNVDLRGCDEEARVLYERALLCPPVNSACVVNLGILYEDLGNYRRAMQCFDLVVQADPDNERARLYRRDAAASLTMYYDEESDRQRNEVSRVFRTPIEDFELSAVTARAIAKAGLRTLGDLVAKSEAELLGQHGVGQVALAEIKDVLRQKGLHVGMDVHAATRWAPDEAVPPDGAGAQADPDSADIRRRPISILDLSIRSQRVVTLLHMVTVGDLADRTEAELLGCPNFGQSSLNEVRRKLDELGLSLRQ